MKSLFVLSLCFLSLQNYAQEQKKLDSLQRQQKYADRALAVSNRRVYFKLEFTGRLSETRIGTKQKMTLTKMTLGFFPRDCA